MSGLQYRSELKFTINTHQYSILRQRLRLLLTTDQHADQNGQYRISSLYFDNLHDSALHDKLAGVQERHKFRVRTYNGDDRLIVLEKKMKRNSYTAKLRQAISKDQYLALASGDRFAYWNGDVTGLLMETCWRMGHELLRPKVIVEYDREAYVSPLGNVRVTFDRWLRSGLGNTDLFRSDASFAPVMGDGQMIMEVKFDSFLPGTIQDILQMEGLTQQAASKYAMCRKYFKSNTWEDQ